MDMYLDLLIFLINAISRLRLSQTRETMKDFLKTMKLLYKLSHR